MIKDIQIWPILAGLGLFLFGMYMLEDSLKMLAGRSFKKFLRKHTGNSIKAVFAGAGVTALLQSSSMVTLLVMSFTGAGIIGLNNGIGMILGANLGTTFTGWLVSLLGFKLNISKAILPFLAIGGLGIMFLKSKGLANLSRLLMGFSFMFLGLGYMKEGFADFAQQADLTFLADKPLILFLLLGFVLTAAIQSSSAAIVIFLSSLAAGVITLQQGFYLAIGANLGTTITAILGTIKGSSIKKKTGWAQFFINVFGAVPGLLLMNVIYIFIKDFLKITDPLISLVAFHSAYNLLTVICILPFLGPFTRFINFIVPDKTVRQSQYISNANPEESKAAIEALEKESVSFLKHTLAVNKAYFHIHGTISSGNAATEYFRLKNYEQEITYFYLKLQQIALEDEEEVKKMNNIVATIRNATLSAKEIKDIKHNLDELYNSVNDSLYGLNKEIKNAQKEIYSALEELMNHEKSPGQEELEQVKETIKSFYMTQSEEIYKLYGSETNIEVDLPTLLNLIMSINSSNESMLRSTGTLLGYNSI